MTLADLCAALERWVQRERLSLAHINSLSVRGTRKAK